MTQKKTPVEVYRGIDICEDPDFADHGGPNKYAFYAVLTRQSTMEEKPDVMHPPPHSPAKPMRELPEDHVIREAGRVRGRVLRRVRSRIDALLNVDPEAF